ncbi:MAG: hypothetical protein H6962_09330 [Chromatiaceae bacterium]|nr:hypothetical protein [Chromatiaceae bacterium]
MNAYQVGAETAWRELDVLEAALVDRAVHGRGQEGLEVRGCDYRRSQGRRR